MLAAALALVLIVQGTRADTLPAPAAAAPADAYLDPHAGELVRLARLRRGLVDRSLTAYRTVATQRVSAGLRAMRRDRVIFRSEVAARILWRRDGIGHVEVLGARRVAPLVAPDPRVPRHAARQAAQLAFDPATQDVLRGMTGEDGDGIRHPLAEGSETDYRFATGDTTRIRLPGGREVRLVELRVIPRRPHGLLLQGSLWLDLDTHSAVRGVFRLSRPLDVLEDLDEDDEEIPGIFRPVEADLRYLTIEYSLWEDRWWLPRRVALEGEGRMGSFVRVPIRFERTYEAYEVWAGEPLAGAAEPDLAIADAREGDTIRSVCSRGVCSRYRAEVPPDSVLLTSPRLPPSIYDRSGVVDEAELRDLAGVLGVKMPGPAWHPPVVRLEYLRPDLVRYNRVEGPAVGARADADFGSVRADGSVWLGLADLHPNAEITLVREGFATRTGLGVYRRLTAVQPDVRALGIGASLSAFLLGRDDGDYYRTGGVELSGSPRAAGRWESRWRLFAERQSAAERNTHWSVPRLFDADRRFHENISADPADQVGAELSLGISRGLDPRGVRWAGGAAVLGSIGSYDFVRSALSGSLGLPLPMGGVAALELAAGSAFGAPPRQSLWYIGGPATVRGYGGPSRIAGEAFWRARGEVGTSVPAARVTLFTDAGWAGPRGDLWTQPALVSVGAGASLLDGLMRVDLSRALRAPVGWRLDLSVDGLI